MKADEALRYLTRDGGRVPCSRYGHDSQSCAPVALAVAEIVAEATGEPVTREALDHAMSLVVNDHDDPFTLIREHGNAEQRALIGDLIEADWTHAARERGREAARNAATWVTDGNESDDSRRRKLAMLQDGDPAVWDLLPTAPNLSGEWADELTPVALYERVTGEPYPEDADLHERLLDAIAEAWLEGVDDTFEDACVTELRKWIKDDS
jgi:hypothetical protein